MKDKIKDKLLKELQEIRTDFIVVAHLNDYQKRIWENACFIEIETKVKDIIKETSKAKDEEELRFLFEMNSKYKLFNGNVFMNDMVKDRIEEIKQRIKVKEIEI